MHAKRVAVALGHDTQPIVAHMIAQLLHALLVGIECGSDLRAPCGRFWMTLFAPLSRRDGGRGGDVAYLGCIPRLNDSAIALGLHGDALSKHG